MEKSTIINNIKLKPDLSNIKIEATIKPKKIKTSNGVLKLFSNINNIKKEVINKPKKIITNINVVDNTKIIKLNTDLSTNKLETLYKK